MNEEVRRTEFVSITCDVGVGGRERENILHKLDMTGHKIFCEHEVKIDEGAMSKGVAKKDTRTRFGVEFEGRVRAQLGKT